MKKKYFIIAILLLLFLNILTACDPVLPTENIDAVYAPSPLIQGASAEINIIYPDTDGTAIVKWTGQSLEVISGDDIVDTSGLTITGLKPGTATLKVSVEANCAFLGIIIDKPVFTTELMVEVE